ncbi:MAG: prolyl oligopeptidase family serine peptidase, partial [Bacteroidota bacterium]
MKIRHVSLLAILLTSLLPHQSISQSEKEVLSIDKMRQWRKHAVTMSDNGEWYTTLYRLVDEPEEAADTVDLTTVQEEISAYYGDENQTDVLYVHSVQQGLKYQIPNGAKPIFSSASDWIAYRVEPDTENDEKERIELKQLATGFTVQYESSAAFRFLEDKNYFVTADDHSLMIYDLNQRSEHYIGDVGEYLVNKKSEYIVYTISSEDKRGNGIYLYDPAKKTTRALQTGSFLFSNLTWNHSVDALAYYKYEMVEGQIDHENISLVMTSSLKRELVEKVEYPSQEMEGLDEYMGLAVKDSRSANPIIWSKDGNRCFVKIKAYDQAEETESENSPVVENATVQVWHWKDEKLLSQRIMEYDRQQNKVFDAVFVRRSNTLIPLTSDEIQKIRYSKGTDQWAIGMDNRNYISDWDVEKNDLYRINLRTGKKKLIRKNHTGSYWNPNYELSPDGTKVVYWDEAHYWVYDFATGNSRNITEGLDVSFVKADFDQFGQVPAYGFTGWVKGQNAVLVNHQYDLWQLPLDGATKAKNLTASVTAKEPIRFRVEDFRFEDEDETADRYIDLSSPIYLHAYHTKTKYAGFYSLQEGQLKELIYGPASFFGPSYGYDIIKSEGSNTIIYRKEDYQNASEAYLSKKDFSKAKKITNTNPQQEKFKWGKRILIDYTNDDGVPLRGILSIPEGYEPGQKLPMVVYSYEKYSWRMYRYPTPYRSGASVPEMLYVSDGYLFLQPDIHFNVGTPHSDMHECIDAAIKKVIELGYVDEDRIGYEGFSFGGHCGMYISTQENRFAAIAAGAGVSNLVQGFNLDIVRDGSNEQDYYMTSQGRLATDPTSDTEMYLRESPVFNAQTMDTPLLLFHGTADKVVLWEHSFGFYSILRYLQKPVVFLSYRGEGHGLDQESNRLDIQLRLKDYFDHYLKGAEAKAWMLEETPYTPGEESG